MQKSNLTRWLHFPDHKSRDENGTEMVVTSLEDDSSSASPTPAGLKGGYTTLLEMDTVLYGS